MATSSDRLTLFFSSLGHMLMHMLAAFFFVVVLTLEGEWDRPYHELIELWTLGALLIGLAALPAGWLADPGQESRPGPNPVLHARGEDPSGCPAASCRPEISRTRMSFAATCCTKASAGKGGLPADVSTSLSMW